MNQKLIAFITIIMLGLTGCSSSGNNNISQLDSNQMANLIYDGRTSKAEIRSHFGDPTRVDLNVDGTEKWSFTHIKSISKVTNFIPIVGTLKRGTHDVKKQLVVLFDKNDVVKKHAFSIAKGETNVGLLG